jgi:hypothetical protein
MEEESLGAMLYGYDAGQASSIKSFLESVAKRDVAVFGGLAREEGTVLDIIEGEPGSGFGAGEDRMLMFLGFDDGLIGAVLSSFSGLGLPRPIFCTLTENNIGWTVSHLMEHLLEEKRAWEERGKGEGTSD